MMLEPGSVGGRQVRHVSKELLAVAPSRQWGRSSNLLGHIGCRTEGPMYFMLVFQRAQVPQCFPTYLRS